jgi:hypothetical protein
VSAVLAEAVARARELLAEPSPADLYGLASRCGALEELLATICDAAEAVRNPGAESHPAGGSFPHPDSAPDTKIIPPCPECTARARRGVRWTGALPSGDSWRCGGCGSTFATPGTEET